MTLQRYSRAVRQDTWSGFLLYTEISVLKRISKLTGDFEWRAMLSDDMSFGVQFISRW